MQVEPTSDFKRPIRAWLRVLVGVAAAAIILLAFWVIGQRGRSGGDGIAAAYLNTAPHVAYVGDDECRTCHATIFESYERSEMGRSWSVPQPEHLQLAEEHESSVIDKNLNLHYRTFVRGDQLFQEEFRPESESGRPHSFARLVNYVVGSGTHGYSFVSETNGYLMLLPMGWYSDASKWDLSPGFERHNVRFDREVPIECVSCHNSIPDYIEGSRNRYRGTLPAGIGCERCHGPGELHVQKQLALLSKPSSGEPDRTIVNPAKLPVDRRDDVCLQCHLISDVAVLGVGKHWNSFRPGERLQDSRRDLFLEPEDPAHFGFSSHASRLRLSRCWKEGATKETLTCITCHDPHKPLAETTREAYVAKCMTCHGSNDCSRPLPDPDPSANCVDCHMRRGRPANVAHTVFTDHWIRSRPQSGSPGTQPVNPYARQGPIRFIDFWNPDEPPDPTVNAIGLAKYFDIRRGPDRRQAIAALAEALENDPDHPDLLFWNGATLGAVGQWKRSLEAYLAAAKTREDPLTLNGLGEAQREMRLLQESVETLTKSGQQFPDFLPTYREMADSYVAIGNYALAMKALDRSLELFPFQPDTRTYRAHLGFQAGESIAQVLDHVDEGLQLDPNSASLYWLQGQCFVNDGQIERAVDSYEAALEMDSKFAPALLSLGPVLLQLNRFDEAQQRLNQLRTVAPSHPMLPAAQRELERARRQARE